MKKYGITSGSFLTLLRKWVSSFQYIIRKHQHQKSVLTPEDKLILLCCGILGKGETKVRKQAKALSVSPIQKQWEDIFPRYHFKELTLESEDFALWIGFAPRNGIKRKAGEYLFCDRVILYFLGEEQKKKFIDVLEDEETYYKLWDHSYTDIEENKFRITVGDALLLPDTPYHISFQEWKDERKRKYQSTVSHSHEIL